MKRNNRGFSLVEFIIAFAIAAIAGTAAIQMMTFGNNSFKQSNTDVGLQYEQQIVVNQLRDYILESSNAIHYDATNNALYVFKQGAKTTTESGVVSAPYEVSKITYVDPNFGLSEGDAGYDTGNIGEMYVNTKPINSLADDYVTELADKGRKLASDVKSINYDMSELKDGRVAFDIIFLSNGKEYASHQVVSLRNTIIDSDSLIEIFEDRTEVTSFIEGVSIYKDGNRMGSTDTVDRPSYVTDNDFVLKAYYSAKVEKNQYSEFDYPGGVTWELNTDTLPSNLPEGAAVTFAEEGDYAVISVVGNVSGTVTLTATSVADPTVKKDLIITINNAGGIYPSEATLSKNDTTIQNSDGTRTYTLKPVIKYTGMVGESDTLEGNDALEKIEWHVKDEQVADLLAVTGGLVDNINPATGQISFNYRANGHSFTFYFTVKQRTATGTILQSNEVTINVEGIPEEFQTPFKIALNQTSMRDDYIKPMIQWNDDYDTKVKYYWKIIPTKDNKSAQWNDASVGSLSTNFEDIVRVHENVISNEVWWPEHIIEYSGAKSYTWDLSHKTLSNINAGIEDWYSVDKYSNWFKGDDTIRGPLAYIQSYLDWKHQYQVKVLCFAMTDDGKKIYDANGMHELTDANTDFEITPIEGVTTIKQVALRITPISKVAINADTMAKEYKTDDVLVPTHETRYFRFTAQGLYLTFMGQQTSVQDDLIVGGYSLQEDNGKDKNNKKRSYTANYTFKSIAGERLAIYDLPTNLYAKDYLVLGFDYNFGTQLQSFRNHKPETMEYVIKLEQRYLNNDGQEIYNSIESDPIKYKFNIDYNTVSN